MKNQPIVERAGWHLPFYPDHTLVMSNFGTHFAEKDSEGNRIQIWKIKNKSDNKILVPLKAGKGREFSKTFNFDNKGRYFAVHMIDSARKSYCAYLDLQKAEKLRKIDTEKKIES